MSRTTVQATRLVAAIALVSSLGSGTYAQQAPFDDDGDVAPAPPSIGADIPLTYFGPAPSEVQKELIGPHKLLKAGAVDLEAGTVTLPLYAGQMASGETVWYVVLDTDDRGNAEALGLNYAPKLTYADVGRAVRRGTLAEGLTLVFEAGTVDFSPERSVVPGDAPNFFPPKSLQPGSVGDNFYSPLVKIENAGGHIYNAPMIAYDVDAATLNRFCDGAADHAIMHDKVVSICPREGNVTLELTAGFSFARPVLYLSTEANHPAPAALEGATFAPGLESIHLGADDSLFSPVERIFVMVNGPTGRDNPHRQGLNSALSDKRTPLNVLGGIPTIATDYSPLWDINLGVWTQAAVDQGVRTRVTEEFQILGLVEDGWITGRDGGEYGSVGFVVNCPIVFRFL
ncbi:MAG: hypothetical protein ERJ67_01695 [Aphanocapsa feldmannii 277cV]|uniref:Uncharacterized protein n=2 Tax=Aphanocapsa feldmannii TaxID=192050 RepID=A0A524RQP3_9CHRO|nr:MAG: hypothetical protein ERJ69_07280 [Aphanocapsa feldmannii 288cV]TGG94850.1 MAG: hypothetical protein ERJ67_01695 [Aphanocapsa feldmannii 277cV]TGH27527.1 MAG: hypothetical protein ERJ68_01065 [Aphanocapsa feldmannii 277cI]